MKILGVQNGWKFRHLWWRYILMPYQYDNTGPYKSLSLFGFVIFYE